jgi:hypothetical protein
MIGVEGRKCDVTIHWPRKSHICPSYHRPRKVKPRALVFLVDIHGKELLTFRLKKIESPRNIIAATGKRYKNGCELIAERGTMRKRWRKTGGPKHPVNKHAIGEFRYFNARTNEGVVFTPAGRGGRDADSITKPRQYHMGFWPVLSNNIGRKLSKPEADLIKRYCSWIKDTTGRFGHNYLKGPGLYTDLFIRSNWTLVEAKSRVNTWKIREAIGQLLDYQRCYPRHPRLAVLLPHRPQERMIGLLKSCRITCIWETAGGWFSDSNNGALTRKLRIP